MQQNPNKIGLYIHIPFCDFMCHYCDFAKTARWDQEIVNTYFKSLHSHLSYWLRYLQKNFKDFSFASINFGGGTPSLFSSEYAPLMELLRPYLQSQQEISIEANPKNCSPTNLSTWRSLGFNRISLGVQSFQRQGLDFLKRNHNPDQAIESCKKVGAYFDNFNIDLIYSWPEQSLSMWMQDLQQAISLKANHLSLYNLTYAEKTPIGRAYLRGKIKELPDTEQVQFYNSAMSLLKKHNYIHEEVSNWSKETFSCIHNWLYWQGSYYLGIGTGAHSYLPSPNHHKGERFYYSRNLKHFKPITSTCKRAVPPQITEIAQHLPIFLDSRQADSWLLEMISCGLRTHRGIDVSYLELKSHTQFVPKNLVLEALESGLLFYENKRLCLQAQEWFRETSWSLLVSECFH